MPSDYHAAPGLDKFKIGAAVAISSSFLWLEVLNS
jgi:hypothetical protein